MKTQTTSQGNRRMKRKTLPLLDFDYGDKELNTEDFFRFYYQKRKKKGGKINDRKNIKSLLGGVLLEIKKQMTERKNGVYLEDFAYFCYKRKNKIKMKLADKSLSILERYFYTYVSISVFKQMFTCIDEWELLEHNKAQSYRATKIDYIPKYNELKYVLKFNKNFFD